ncbi:MAG: NUDIX hydrolase [Austwickia sp.]|jgi:8-oxo-dGDP phosphatase|nr:NUDIX hydrolase [Austwickia sp.]MBK8435673.1 NUDIX hydrolase [Austwickia sp.]MBK9100759.1 NUDIX hydrolase [Austwickia sp.]
MSLSAPVLTASELADEVGSKPVQGREIRYHGLIWDVHRDDVELGAAGVVRREYIGHPGAVVVVALRPDPASSADRPRDQVFLVKQYRHPVTTLEWELPAGLLDVQSEPPWQAAARELAEEADLVAGRWDVLLDFYPSPGAMSEAIRIFVARELADVPAEQRHARTGEELGMAGGWVDLDEAHTAALTGRLNNASAIMGILAAHAGRARGWQTLRSHDAPWPQHPSYRHPTGT